MPHTSLPHNANKPKKLLDRLRDRIRLKNYSYRTEKTYARRVRRDILFYNRLHPQEMGRAEIESSLTHLAVERNVAPSTQNQALHAILFLYREVLEQPIPDRINAVRAQERRRLPTVLTLDEVQRLLNQIAGVPHLVSLLLYGSGLRVREALSLRIKEFDFDRRQITVRPVKATKTASPYCQRAPSLNWMPNFWSPKHSISAILPRVMVGRRYPTRWHPSIPMPIRNGAGSFSSPRRDSPKILSGRIAHCIVSICMRA
jgi:site-specific recombinase XerD